MKAIVLEIKNGEAAVLREDGVVVTTRQHCRVGDTVEVPERVEARPARRFRRLRRVVAAAVLAVLIMGSTFGYLSVSASSYVSMDAGDASLEFGINHFGRVVSVEALDEDSEPIADELRGDLRHRPFGEAMGSCLIRLEERGSIGAGGRDPVIAGLTAGNERQREALRGVLEALPGQEGRPAPRFYTMDVSPEEREEALGQRQSPGMFAFERRDDWAEADWESFFEEMSQSDHPPLGPGGKGPQPPGGMFPPQPPVGPPHKAE